MRKAEKERLEKLKQAAELCREYHMDPRVNRLYEIVDRLSPSNELQENLDKLLQELKSIHQSESFRMEKAIEDFKEKRGWKITSLSKNDDDI